MPKKTKDIDYFYERDLDETNLKGFHESLPSHLQQKFEEVLKYPLSFLIVLQGYGGPSHMQNGGSGDSKEIKSSYGIQEIRFRWGMRKDINIIPIFGQAAYIGGKFADIHQSVWCSLYFDSKTGECLSHNKDKAAEKLDDKARQLFQERKYTEAAEYHNNAYLFCSAGYHNEGLFKDCRDGAQAEVDAIKLNSQGENLFRQGKYTEAQNKFQEAYNKSRVTKEKNIYANNKDKAQAEIDAIDLNSQGENLFRQGKYSEAQNKFQEAYNKSRVTKEENIYANNRDKAQAEIDAINLNSQGENLFRQGKYTEAQNKFQEAYNKSGVTKETNIYANNKNKAQTIVNKLSIIDTLWNKAWDAENDTINDRCEEAKEIFQKALSESKDGLKIFPDNLRFKHYETLISLKIEGNELFNQGLKLQQDGIALLQIAQELKQQRKYELANTKFKEAIKNFRDAQEKFKIGKENDQRFVSCFEFVQEQINEVMDSIEITEQNTLSSEFNNLDINSSDNCFNADSCESDITGEHIITIVK